jgi:hypothetical protein
MFPCPLRGQRVLRAHWGHYPYRQLIPLPSTYLEVEDVRPGEDELQCITDKIFVSTAGGISISKELNRNILQFLTGNDLLRFEMVSKKAKMIVEHCHALIFDAIHERLCDLLGELNIDWSRRHVVQVNEHKFKAGNCVCVHGQGGVNGYCGRVTPKYVFYVCEIDIFKHHPTIRRVGNNDRVAHAHPYYGHFVETVQNWRTWSSLTQEFLDSD